MQLVVVLLFRFVAMFLLVSERMSMLYLSKMGTLLKAGDAVQDAGAAAVIFAAPEGHDVSPINCKDQECMWPLSTPATMISHDAGVMLLVSFALVLWVQPAEIPQQICWL